MGVTDALMRRPRAGAAVQTYAPGAHRVRTFRTPKTVKAHKGKCALSRNP